MNQYPFRNANAEENQTLDYCHYVDCSFNYEFSLIEWLI